MSLLLKERHRDKVDRLRPVGVVSTTQKWAALTLCGALGPRLETTRLNAYAYRRGVGLERAVMPVSLCAKHALEWRSGMVLISINVKHAFPCRTPSSGRL